SVAVLAGNGDGTFRPPLNFKTGNQPKWVAVADFNEDGIADLIVANSGSADVSILLGNGDGTFQPAVRYGAGPGVSALALGDFNGDGHLDAAVATSLGVALLHGRGDGTFGEPVYIGRQSTFVLAADFNGDGMT